MYTPGGHRSGGGRHESSLPCEARTCPAWPAGIHRISCPAVLGRAHGSSAGPGGRGQVQVDTICRQHRRLWPTSLKKELYKRAIQGFSRGLRSKPSWNGCFPGSLRFLWEPAILTDIRGRKFLPGWVQPTSDLPTDLEGAATFYRDGTTVVPSHAPAEVH